MDDALRVETMIARRLSVNLHNLDILEIGPGQFLSQMRYFALSNRMVGIDLEVIAEGINPLPYLMMLRCNGFARTAKTIIRKLIGIDRRFAVELQRQMRSTRSPKLDVRQMDACQMSFPTTPLISFMRGRCFTTSRTPAPRWTVSCEC